MNFMSNKTDIHHLIRLWVWQCCFQGCREWLLCFFSCVLDCSWRTNSIVPRCSWNCFILFICVPTIVYVFFCVLRLAIAVLEESGWHLFGITNSSTIHRLRNGFRLYFINGVMWEATFFVLQLYDNSRYDA